MSGERQKRREQIQRALSFIKCSLPYPDPEGYEGFVVQLVCDLLEEGNAAFREGDSTEARDHFSEGVNVALYAQAEGLNVPAALLESLSIRTWVSLTAVWRTAIVLWGCVRTALRRCIVRPCV